MDSLQCAHCGKLFSEEKQFEIHIRRCMWHHKSDVTSLESIEVPLVEVSKERVGGHVNKIWLPIYLGRWDQPIA